MNKRTKLLPALVLLLCVLTSRFTLAKVIPTERVATENKRLADPARRLAEIVKRVENSNAVSLVGENRWQALLAGHREGIEGSSTHAQFAAIVNRLFHSTDVSHFKYYTEDDWGYWHLRGALGPGRREAVTEHIGIVPQRISGKWFVRGILEGSVASSKNIRVGDELLNVNGERFRPVQSFRGKDGEMMTLELKRKPGSTHTIRIAPKRESIYAAVQKSVHESISLIPYDGLNLAYMHGWTLLGSGGEYDDILELQDSADGLLLDYRDGYGGTWHRASRFLLGRDRSGSDPQWHKPVVILTADGTRSAKEIVVDAVKKAKRAPLIGEPTPGAVTAVGGVVAVGDDGLLLLPGFRFDLEGHPTQPDYLLTRDIRYCGGTDTQLDAACKILTDLIRPARSPTRTSQPDTYAPPRPLRERHAP